MLTPREGQSAKRRYFSGVRASGCPCGLYPRATPNPHLATLPSVPEWAFGCARAAPFARSGTSGVVRVHREARAGGVGMCWRISRAGAGDEPGMWRVTGGYGGPGVANNPTKLVVIIDMWGSGWQAGRSGAGSWPGRGEQQTEVNAMATATVRTRGDEQAVAVIRTAGEAVTTARAYADTIADGVIERDRAGRVPVAELAAFDASGLLGITVPRSDGGPEFGMAVLAEVIRTIAAVDPAIAQAPQSH